MAIYRLLRNSTFDTREVSKMTKAYELVLTELGIADRADPRTETIASAIVHRASAAESDVRDLADFAKRRLIESGAAQYSRRPISQASPEQESD
jgi:hypothetical protein